MSRQMNVIEHWDIAVQELSERDKILKNIISNYRGERLKLKNDGFLTLARAIVGQQISVKAADTIWKRLEITANGNIDSTRIRELSTEQLRKTGLSSQKTAYLRNIAESEVLRTDWDECSDEKIIRMDLKIGIDTPYPTQEVWSSMRLIRKEGEAAPSPAGKTEAPAATAEPAAGKSAEAPAGAEQPAATPAATKPKSDDAPEPTQARVFSSEEKAAMLKRAKAHAAEVKARKG